MNFCERRPVDDIRSAGIDDVRVAIFTRSLEVILITLMNMPMGKKTRVVLIHNVQEGGKTGMRETCVIAETVGGRVGDKNIDSARTPEFKTQLIHA